MTWFHLISFHAPPFGVFKSLCVCCTHPTLLNVALCVAVVTAVAASLSWNLFLWSFVACGARIWHLHAIWKLSQWLKSAIWIAFAACFDTLSVAQFILNFSVWISHRCSMMNVAFCRWTFWCGWCLQYFGLNFLLCVLLGEFAKTRQTQAADKTFGPGNWRYLSGCIAIAKSSMRTSGTKNLCSPEAPI